MNQAQEGHTKSSLKMTSTHNTNELHKLAQAMCSIDLTESHWTQELPRLPVPDLWITVSRYLASLKAVLAPTDSLDDMLNKQLGCKLSKDQIKTNWSRYEQTDQLVRQFMRNEGPQLQRDLKEYANKCQNWATEYWLQDMYLSNPAPLPVNSNPFFLFPRQKFSTSNDMLMFATRIIQFSVDFKYGIDQQALRQDFGSGHGKGKPMCMETYKNFFHSYRMPHEDMDRLLPQSRRSNHIVVASCNQFYILRLGQDPLEDPYRKDTSSQLNEASIFDQLLRIYRVSREHFKRDQLATSTNNEQQQQKQSSNGQKASRIVKVGLFTTENRKTWAQLHKKLIHCQGSSNSNSTAGDDNQQHCNGSSHSPMLNVESLKQIEDCLFVMCLDSLVSAPNNKRYHHHRESSSSSASEQNNADDNDDDEAQLSDVEAANIILTGGGSHLFTANRWFDKFLQIIVGRNGICGINIEHSASEGITVLRFLEDFLSYLNTNPIHKMSSLTNQIQVQSSQVGTAADTQNNCANQSNNNNRPPQLFNYDQSKPPSASLSLSATNATATADSITSTSYVEPMSPSALLEESDKITPLMWHLDAELLAACSRAEQAVDKLIDNFSLYIMKFEHFGRTFIKNQHLSPDAFVQLALQYTFFRLHGCLVSTYESASLRQFRLGRVDNIRANTCETYSWIQAMLMCKQSSLAAEECQLQSETDNNNRSQPIFRQAETAFAKAMSKQVEILRYTIVGGAPDNHLLALKELAKIRYGPDELPDMFNDSSYREFINFRLSTSQLPNESGISVGYGAVVPDGYGCSYNPCESRIMFCISSFVDCPETSSSKFAQVLDQSLLEMQQLCLGRTNSEQATT